MKRWLITGLLLLCLVLVSLTACGGSAAEAQQQLVEVTRGDILLSITAEGNLSLPWHRQLTFGTIGTVAKINVEKGDMVTKGQVMASLDTTSLEQAMKTRELAVKSAEIDLESAQNSLYQLTTPYPFVTFAFALPESLDEVRVALQRVKEAQAELVLGLEGESYDMAEMKEDLRQAKESLTDAESKLAAGLGQGVKPSLAYWTLRAAQMAVDKAQVALDSANNELDKARSELEKAIIVAPFAGVVADVSVKEGDKLSSMDYATKTIIELIDPTTIELKAELDEIDVPDIKLNQRAIIEVDALPDLELEGEVTYIYPVSIEESGVILYQVIISFDVPPGSVLKSGMSATADIIMDERSQVLLVPDRAVEYDEEGNTVVQVMVDEQIEERAVVVGISDGYLTEIVDGLSEGEIVVIEVSAKTESSGFFQ